ncbi:heavy metal sensor histidine kinase [Hahella sp. HN01]|uniref:heavy metal sensor histidine kinase n=1 Tax=Hahella sp. HN01 TaxID=2847262 RepID=UPI001C1EB097|nr:heavy metal sensor histidine kinase [Hahella sp. HN01]MBU6951289.1 heavy metal sensor histidine kinase [Hahella sp. HN01]
MSSTKRPLPLAVRITALVGIAILAVFLVFGWLIERTIDQHFMEQDSAVLKEAAAVVEDILFQHWPAEDIDMLQRKLDRALPGRLGVICKLSKPSSEVIYASPEFRGRGSPGDLEVLTVITADNLRMWRDGQNLYRGIRLKLSAPEAAPSSYYLVTLALEISAHRKFMKSYRHTLWASTLLAALVGICGVWVGVGRGLAPLRRVSNRIRGVSSDRLHVRLELDAAPIELVELAASFNDMMQRVETSYQRLSNFAADIAHELRTPVTNLMTQTQVALSKGRGVEEYREVLYSGLEEFERISKMIDDMLLLARTESGLGRLSLEKVSLRQEVQDLLDYFEAWAEAQGVSLTLKGRCRKVRGDRMMLRRAVSNLLSNAIRHTPEGGTVSVSLCDTPGFAVVSVANPGPGIPPEHLSRVFDRFYRVDDSRCRTDEGAGLGLAIVKSIVEAHGGFIAANSEQNHTQFVMKMPGK